MRIAIIALPLITLASPALAQQHDGHQTEASSSVSETDETFEPDTQQSDQGSMNHSAMDHSAMDQGADQGAAPTEQDHSQMQHGTMEHGTQSEAPATGQDHSAMDHGAMAMDEMPIPQGPPPPEAFSGPAYAADAFVGADVMSESRAHVAREVSGLPVYWFQGDRLEYRLREGSDGYLWDVQGYYGGDIDKFWFKSEGEGSFGEPLESAQVQALWSHAIAPFFDLQAGVRQDLTGPERTHLVLGIQGLAPYVFEVDAAAFMSTKGDLTATIEAEVDQRITNRLILQPRVELALSAQDVPELGIGAGIDRIEAGVRLRYEFAREFAPYIGIDQEWRVGQSADYARAEGEDPSVTNYVVGIRFWF